MGKPVFLSVLGATLLALLLGIYLSSLQGPQTEHAGFPWQVKRLASGQTQVFGLTIGESTLQQAELAFREPAEITLFVPQNQPASVEAFFNDVKIAGLKSKIVLSLDVPAGELQQMQNRGVRISTLGSGTRKITLSGEDIERVKNSPLTSMTYLPSIHLSAELIERRFGTPLEKLTDPSSDAVHWLYPEMGVDIALSESRKEVIQYVPPQKFATVSGPLRKAATP